MGPGDTIRISILNAPELSNSYHLESDGTVKLPLVGDVSLGGLTESEAARVVDKAYQDANIVLRPQATVFISDFSLNGVSVVGEVGKPGNYRITGSRTLVDIIAEAGGLSVAADTHITIQRANGAVEDDVSMPLDNAATTLEDNVLVSAGDKVMVRRAGMVYVLGDVSKPGGYLMQHNGRITALQALAQANGTSRTSGENKSVLVRHVGSSYDVRPLRIRDMSKGKAPDIDLVAGDVIYVPASNARNFVFNAPQILGSLAGAAIYSVNR